MLETAEKSFPFLRSRALGNSGFLEQPDLVLLNNQCQEISHAPQRDKNVGRSSPSAGQEKLEFP